MLGGKQGAPSVKFMTHFRLEPKSANSMPYCYSNPTGQFDSWEDARRIAFASAESEAHSIVIELLNSDPQEETWVRDGEGWRRDYASRT